MIPGFHIHYNKAMKNDSYVSPIPDSRLNLVRIFTLSEAINANSTVIPIEENPENCTLENDRRFLKIGNELVTYEQYTTTPPYQFSGCKRGALSTKISEFEKGFNSDCSMLIPGQFLCVSINIPVFNRKLLNGLGKFAPMPGSVLFTLMVPKMLTCRIGTLFQNHSKLSIIV